MRMSCKHCKQIVSISTYLDFWAQQRDRVILFLMGGVLLEVHSA
jgi:hypothetical protein